MLTQNKSGFTGMMKAEPPTNFVTNVIVRLQPDRYMDIMVNTSGILESWQASLFSFEWMLPDGRIKTLEELSEDERNNRMDIERKIEKGEALEKPVLGIGLRDNVEIGSGRAVFLTLAAHGVGEIPVHIPKNDENDFKVFRCGEDIRP